MTNNTEEAGVSSTATAQEGETPEATKARADLIKKASTRMDEVAERVALIVRAMTGAMPELIKNHSLGEIMELYTLFEDAVNGASSQVVGLGKILSYAREVSLPERLDGDELKTFTAINGDRMSRTARSFASILPNMVEDAYKWLRDNEYESLIKETVNSSSLSAASKELMENGKELPDHLFRVHMKDGVSITRSKKKG